MDFDETKAVEAINAALTAAGRSSYDADQVLNLIDMIWDFYEENGLLEIDPQSSEETEGDDLLNELVDYAHRMLRRDKGATIKADDVEIMVKAELAYEDTVL